MTPKHAPPAIARRQALAAAAAAALALPRLARAQDAWPSRNIAVVVPYAPGGTGDVFARLVSERLRGVLGQNVVVENRSGASGMIGTQAVARATPDGHTLLFGQAPEIAISRSYLTNPPVDTEKDLLPIALVGDAALGLVVNAASPYRSLQDLLAAGKARGGQITFASSGAGTPGHFAAEMLSRQGGAGMVHVPYRGAGPALADLLGNHVGFFFSGMPAAVPHVREGRLRLLAVSTARRTPAAPEVPTVAESGLPGFAFSLWGGFFAPAGTPAPVVERLNQEVNRIIADPQIRARLVQEGAEVTALSPAEFARFVRAEIAKYAQVVAETGLRQE